MKEEWTVREISEILGISKQALLKRYSKEKWAYKERPNHKGGGERFFYSLPDLPPDIQKQIISKSNEDIPPEELEGLAPEAQLEAYRKMVPMEQFSFSRAAKKMLKNPQRNLFPGDPMPKTKPFSISPDVLQDDRVGDIVEIVGEAENVPPGYKKTKWVQMVAIRYSRNPATIYRYMRRYDRAGLAGLKHRKSTGGTPRSWNPPEAIDFWVGLCLKREHRNISKEALYECLMIEANKRGWRIGSYRSALWWFDKRVTPQLLALQRGGVRALDNTLPPICRDYSDLKPFEILVGDQHRFDFWVMDDETGEVFRPEGYFWQDLRTRCFYGGAVAERYDSHLMGLALRIGLRRFGAFGSIYTDHGKPEESKYIMGVLKEMRALDLGIEETFDIPADVSGADPEEMICRIMLPGDHRKAIVRNAKAKMIESTFNSLEKIFRNQLRLSGNVKRLAALQEEWEIDEKEAETLARAGKLLTFKEFVLAAYRALDFYNDQKDHRGVLREWLWDPKPKKATPMQCLRMCYTQDGWRPRRLPEDAIELAFLPRAKRAVDKGRIIFRKEHYEHEALMSLDVGERVEIRFDPLDQFWLLVLHRGKFLCRAEPIEYSSMRDRELAERKIGEKAKRRRMFTEQYRQLTSWLPDFREYSRVPAAERAAAVIGKAKRETLKRAEEDEERYRIRTTEELAAEAKRIESYTPPERKPAFHTEEGRYQHGLDRMAQGENISDEDAEFMNKYEAKMSIEGKQYWSTYKDVIGLKRGI